jgi:hypothetical protein
MKTLISSLFALLVVTACASTTAQFTSATSADGVVWPFCGEVIDTNLVSTKFSLLFCGNDSIVVAKEQAAWIAQHPTYQAQPVKPAQK